MIVIAGFALIAIVLIIIIAAAAAKAASGQKTQNDMSLKKAYLYLVSVISLVIAVVGAIILLNMVLKSWVFPKADDNYYYPVCSRAVPDGKELGCDPQEEERQRQAEERQRSSQRQRDAAQALAMIIVATPVWWYHWTQARKEV